MQSFRADTLDAAMDRAYLALGPEAVILTGRWVTKRVRGALSTWAEVTAVSPSSDASLEDAA